jgi:hypothetical protein
LAIVLGNEARTLEGRGSHVSFHNVCDCHLPLTFDTHTPGLSSGAPLHRFHRRLRTHLRIHNDPWRIFETLPLLPLPQPSPNRKALSSSGFDNPKKPPEWEHLYHVQDFHVSVPPSMMPESYLSTFPYSTMSNMLAKAGVAFWSSR